MKNAFIFLLGTGTGGAITYFALRKYFQQIADQEISDMEDYYKERFRDLDDLEEREKQFNEMSEEKQLNDKVKKEYIEHVQASQYTNYSNSDPADSESPSEEDEPAPYRIAVEEFGQFPDDGWEDDSYTWYADTDEVVNAYGETLPEEDVLEHLGSEFKELFEQEDTDTIYIRNEKYRRDYEIVRDTDETINNAN